MFNIYIKDYNKNGQVISAETLIQTIPANEAGQLKLINPIVKCNMGNAESFDFSIESGTKFYDAFLQMKTFIRVEYDGTNIFYGRVVTVDTGMFGTRRVNCEGPLAFFNDSFMPGIKKENRRQRSVKEHMQEIIDDYNNRIQDPKRHFVLGEIPGDYSSSISNPQKIGTINYKFGADSWTGTKSALEDLRSHLGGYFRTRVLSNGNIALDWLDQYFNSELNAQSIEVGKNIIDLSIATEVENIFTVLIPVGKKNVQSSKTEGGTTTEDLYVSNSREILVPDICSERGGPYSRAQLDNGYHRYDDYLTSINRFGRIVKTVNIDDANDAATLRTKAYEWIKNNYQGDVSKFTVKAVDMHQIGQNASKILCGDKVHIIYPKGSDSGTITKATLDQTCLSITYDLYNPENNQYTFGIPANILTHTYGLVKQANSIKSDSTKPRSESGGSKDNAEWFYQVKSWLVNHTVYYEGDKPYKQGYSGMVTDRPYGGASSHWNYFYDTSGYSSLTGNFALWYAVKRPGSESDVYDSGWNSDVYEALQNKGGYVAAEEYRKAHLKNYHWNIYRYTLDGPLDEATLTESNLIPYIYDVYGINLAGSVNGVDGPNALTTGDGSQINLKTYGGQLISKSVIESNGTEVHTPDGRTVFSLKDDEGNWTYYTYNEDGEIIETNVKDIHRTLVQDERNFYNLTSSYFITSYDEHGVPQYEAIDYKFGQAVEEYANGELVVAYVEGDRVRIGSKGTDTSEDVARYKQVDICGQFHYEKDENGVDYIYLDAAGGTRTRRGMLDDDGNFIYDEQGKIIYHESGIFDRDSLTSGIIATKINNTSYAFIKGDKIVLGKSLTQGGQLVDKMLSNALQEAGIIVPQGEGEVYVQELVAKSIYTQDISTINATVAGKLTTTDLESEISKLNSVTANSLLVNGTGTIYATQSITSEGHIYVGGKIRLTTAPDSQGHAGIKEFSDNAICSAYIDRVDNTYTLHLFNIWDTEYQVPQGKSLSFSRAISSFSGAWSGGPTVGTFTLTASPQNQVYEIKFEQARNAYQYSGTLPYWNNNLYMIPFMYYETPKSGSAPVAYPTSIFATVNVPSLINSISADTLADTPGTNTRSIFEVKALRSNNVSLKSNHYFISEPTTYVSNAQGEGKHCVNIYESNSDGSTLTKLVGRRDVESVYEEGLADESIARIFGATIVYNVESDVNLTAITTHGKTKNRTLYLEIGQYPKTNTTTEYCVNVFHDDSHGDIVGRINIQGIYTEGKKAETIKAIDAASISATAEGDVKLTARTTTGNKPFQRTLVLQKSTFYASGVTLKNCVNVRVDSTDGTVVGRISTQSVYEDGQMHPSSSVLETLTATSNNHTYTPSSGKYGFSSVRTNITIPHSIGKFSTSAPGGQQFYTDAGKSSQALHSNGANGSDTPGYELSSNNYNATVRIGIYATWECDGVSKHSNVWDNYLESVPTAIYKRAWANAAGKYSRPATYVPSGQYSSKNSVNITYPTSTGTATKSITVSKDASYIYVKYDGSLILRLNYS